MWNFKIYSRHQSANKLFAGTVPNPHSFVYGLSALECHWSPVTMKPPFQGPGPYCPLAVSACLLKYCFSLEYFQFDVRIQKTPNYQYLNLNSSWIFWHPIGLKFPWQCKPKTSLFVLIRILNWRKFKLMNLLSCKINSMCQTQSKYFTINPQSQPLWEVIFYTICSW